MLMLNTVMESHNAEVRAYEDLKDKLEDVIEKLRERVPHSDILDYLKVKDRNPIMVKNWMSCLEIELTDSVRLSLNRVRNFTSSISVNTGH